MVYIYNYVYIYISPPFSVMFQGLDSGHRNPPGSPSTAGVCFVAVHSCC